MALRWTDTLDGVDWHALSELYRVAPLGIKPPDHLAEVFGNSRFRRFVHEGDRIVAAGRALSDGRDCSYICDVAVHPSHQGTGLGRRIVAELVAASAGHKKIILYAVKGKEPFYARLGFKRMTTAMAIFADQAGALERGLLTDD